MRTSPSRPPASFERGRATIVRRFGRSSKAAWGCALLAFALLLVIPACGGDEGPGESSDGGARASRPPDGGVGATSSAGVETTPGTGGESGGETGEEGGDPDARFNLVASPDNVECSYVPSGHQSGADLLNVHFFFLIIGGNPPDVPLLSVTGQSDTGLATSYNSGPHNQAVSSAQFALRPEDFGRTHAVTLTVDAGGQVPETDESDNRIRVSVSLPSPRPSRVIDPLACSASRA